MVGRMRRIPAIPIKKVRRKSDSLSAYERRIAMSKTRLRRKRIQNYIKNSNTT
jgi:hypothetical protein